ncbi:MAG: FAD-binding oxidoreductase [Actinomycetota bacterium]|nr:FAD-binding oxidoreductase [Actinomycetota bacterium]
MSDRVRNPWGWGFADAVIDGAAARTVAAGFRSLLGFGAEEPEQPVPAAATRLAEPRLPLPPGRLGEICTRESAARAGHAYGRSYLDVVRALRGRYDHAPDVVAFPRHEADVAELLEWAELVNAAVVPYGGGTSVVGGVEPRLPGRFAGALTVDLGLLDRVLEIDPVSRAARIQAGASGPRLEEQLRQAGLTLRFYPQSFELSTLGGWLATRASGHYATRLTHIDDVVESIRAITPAGEWQSRRLPGSGAGPSPDRMLLGSEGILGVITEAWVRVRPRPSFRASRSVRFPSFLTGADAVRAVVQSGLDPANCRLLDPLEAAQTGSGDGHHAVLVLGFESADHPVDGLLDIALALCATHGGSWDGTSGDPARGDVGLGDATEGAWRSAFLQMPYLRDLLLRLGVLSDTFETAITWDRFPAFHAAVVGATRAALGEPSRVSCRFSHVYPDGPALYYTVLAPVARGAEEERWHQMKRAASDAILAAGGTITHHHAVGRDHREWYDAQRPEPFAAALRAAKDAVDPAGRLNPGVLID